MSTQVILMLLEERLRSPEYLAWPWCLATILAGSGWMIQQSGIVLRAMWTVMRGR